MDQMEIYQIISKNLKDLIDDKGITQVELSKILNVSESTVGKWLLGKAVPRMGIIEKLSNYFNVSKSYIMEDHENNIPNSHDENTFDDEALEILDMLNRNDDLKVLFKKTSNLSDKDKEQIVRILKATLPPDC